MSREAWIAVSLLVLGVAVAPAHAAIVLVPEAPTAIVAIGHGYGHDAEDWVPHMQEIAGAGAAVFAAHYGNWESRRGAEELVAFTRALKEDHPGLPTLLLGVSMGGASTGLALREPGLFDYYVASEAVSRLDETYAEANAAAPLVGGIASETARAIERECPTVEGGPADPACLAAQSYALHGAEIALAGVKGAWVVHDVNDGLVPYDQGVQGAAALSAAGIPLHFTTVLRDAECGDNVGTTLTGHGGQKDVACLAGHSTESVRSHAVIAETIEIVKAFARTGAGPARGVQVLDGGVHVLP